MRSCRFSLSSGASDSQSAVAAGHLGWNGHPGGRESKDGGIPGIPRIAPFFSNDGKLAISSCV
jgi:hypothetical protein